MHQVTMRIKYTPLVVLAVTLVAAITPAQVTTVEFVNTSGVPSGHTPMTGGLLHPESQNFQEAGMHIEAFWKRNDETEFDHGHFHHVELGWETTHGFQSTSGLGQDLIGVYIRRVGGGTFDFLGLNCRNKHDGAQNLMFTGAYDPALPWAPQFTFEPVGPGTFWQQIDFQHVQDLDGLFITADIGLISNQHFYMDDVRIGFASDVVTDPLEDASFTGGAGWLDQTWTTTGQVSLVELPGAVLRNAARIEGDGTMTRAALTIGVLNARMSVEVMISDYEGTDTASLQVSADGVNYTTLRDFTVLDSDGQFYEYQFDLGFLAPAPVVSVRMTASTVSPSIDYCFLDNVVIRGVVETGGTPPVADAGPDQTVEDPGGSGSAQVTLDGSASYDPDGVIVSYEWSEGGVVLGSSAILPVNFVYGQHVVTLTVVDNEQFVSTDDVIITTAQGAVSPVANAGPDQTVEDPTGSGFAPATLDGTASFDPNGVIVSYEWSEGGVVIGTGAILQVNFTYGQHVVTLTVVDDEQGSATDDVTFTSIQVNFPPEANAGPDQTVGDPTGSGSALVTLDGTGSFDPDGTIASYEWTEGGVVLGASAILPVSFAYGQHVVTLTVVDNDQNVSTDDVTITTLETPTTTVIAADGFESGGLLGGTGSWVGSWTPTGPIVVGSGGTGGIGSYSRMTNLASLVRTVDTSSASQARLTFRYKIHSFEPGDLVHVEASSDGVNFTLLQQFTSVNSIGVWTPVDLDLAGLATSSNFVIRFRTDTQAHDARDYFFLDEVEVLSSN